MRRKKKTSNDSRRPPRRPRSSASSSNQTTPPGQSQSPPIGSPSGFELTSFRQDPLSSADPYLPLSSSPPPPASHDVSASRPPLQPQPPRQAQDRPTQRGYGRGSHGSASQGATVRFSSTSSAPPRTFEPPSSRIPTYDGVDASHRSNTPDPVPIATTTNAPAAQQRPPVVAAQTIGAGTFIRPLASPPAGPSGSQPQFLASAPILQLRIPSNPTTSPTFSQLSPWSYENPSLLDNSFSPGMSPVTPGQRPGRGQQQQPQYGINDPRPFDEESIGSHGSAASSEGGSIKAPFSDQVKSLDALLTTPDPLGALGRTPQSYYSPEEEDDYLGSELKKLEDSRRSLQQELDEANLSLLMEFQEDEEHTEEGRKPKASSSVTTANTLKQQLFRDTEEYNDTANDKDRIFPSSVAPIGSGIYNDVVVEEKEITNNGAYAEDDSSSTNQSWMHYLGLKRSPSSKHSTSPHASQFPGKRKASSPPLPAPSPAPSQGSTKHAASRKGVASSTASSVEGGGEHLDSDPNDSLASNDSLFHSLALFSERFADPVPVPDRAALEPQRNDHRAEVSPRQSWVVSPDTTLSSSPSGERRERDESATPFSVRLDGASFASGMSSPQPVLLVGSPAESMDFADFSQRMGSQSPGTSFQLLNESLQTTKTPGELSPETTSTQRSHQQTPEHLQGQSPGTSVRILNESFQTPRTPGQPSSSPENQNTFYERFPPGSSTSSSPENQNTFYERFPPDSSTTTLGISPPQVQEVINPLRRIRSVHPTIPSASASVSSLLHRRPASYAHPQGYQELSSPSRSDEVEPSLTGYRRHPWSKPKRTTFSAPPPDTSLSPSLYSPPARYQQINFEEQGAEEEPQQALDSSTTTEGAIMTTPVKTGSWTLPGLSDSPLASGGSVPASPLFVHQDISMEDDDDDNNNEDCNKGAVEETEGRFVEFQFEPHPDDWKATTPTTFQCTAYEPITPRDESTVTRYVARRKMMLIYKCCLGVVAAIGVAIALGFGLGGGSGINGPETPDSGTVSDGIGGRQSFLPSSWPSTGPTITPGPSMSVLPSHSPTVTGNPTESPQPTPGPTAAPTVSPTVRPLDDVSLQLTYGILVENDIVASIPQSSYSPDLIESMDRLASEVFLDLESNLGRRPLRRNRKLSIMLQLPTSIEKFSELKCPVPSNSARCETVTAEIVLQSGESHWEEFKALLEVGVQVGRMQYYLEEVNPNSPVTILDSTWIAPTENPQTPVPIPTSTRAPAQAQTPAPVDPTPSPVDPPTSKPEPPPAPVDPTPPVDPPTSEPEPAPDDLLSFLVSISFDRGSALKSDGSAQHQAYEWLSGNRDIDFFSDKVIIQRYVMATLYYSTGGDNWYANANWLDDDDECEWYSKSGRRKVCNPMGELTNLELDFNDLVGSLPPELALLTSLERINVRGGPVKFMEGTIPTELGLLTNMESFVVRGNAMDGAIPTELGSWLPAQQLDFSHNRFSGPLPTEFGNFKSVSMLQLGSNDLTGELPSEIGQLTDCLKMYLDDNMFSGPLPSEIGKLNKLQDLFAGMNLFTSFPSEMGRLTFMDTLSIYNNEIQGALPTDLGRLRRLRFLELQYNAFTGSIPSELGRLVDIRDRIDLSFNHFSGSLPSSLGELEKLRILEFQHNRLSGTLPPELSGLKRLTTIRLDSNEFQGNIPEKVCGLFNRTYPAFYADCGEFLDECPCCTFCCATDGTCVCRYRGTPLEYLCFQTRSLP